METGRKHFGSNEVETDPNRELHFRNIPDSKRVDFLSPEEKRLGPTLRPLMYDTITPQEAASRDCQVAQALSTTSQASHLTPKTTAQLEADTETEMNRKEHKGELNTRPMGLPDTSHSDPMTGQQPSEEYPGDPDRVKKGLYEPAPAEYTSTTNKDTEIKPSSARQDSTHRHQTDILLLTPTGVNVLWQDMKWEHNPYAKACRDTSDLLGIAPGHYHLWASHTATTLCALVQTDLRSQFYKTPPAKESKPSLQPGFLLGKDKSYKKPGAICFPPPSSGG